MQHVRIYRHVVLNENFYVNFCSTVRQKIHVTLGTCVPTSIFPNTRLDLSPSEYWIV